MKKSKFIAVLLIVLMLSPILTGCDDSKEVDDQVYALVIGVDKGVDNRVRITIQYPTYKGGGGEEEGGGMDTLSQVGNTVVSTVEAPSILEAISILGLSVTRRVSLVHTKMIIFSEDFAREGIGSFLQPIARFRETRRAMQIIVCKGTAEDFIMQNKTLVGQGLSKALELKLDQAENTGFFPRTSFLDFYKSVISHYIQGHTAYAGINDYSNLKPINKKNKSPLKTEQGLLPGEAPRKGDLQNEFVGTAVFNGDKMVGALNSYETRYFLMVLGKFERGIMTIEDKNAPGEAIVFDLRPGRRPKIKASFVDGKPTIRAVVNIEADIVSIQSRSPYEQPEGIDKLNEQLTAHIQKGIENVIKKAQKEFKTDIFGFGYKVARSFATIQEFEQYKWLEHYPDTPVEVKVQVNVRRTGLMITSSPVIYSEAAAESAEEQ